MKKIIRCVAFIIASLCLFLCCVACEKPLPKDEDVFKFTNDYLDITITRQYNTDPDSKNLADIHVFSRVLKTYDLVVTEPLVRKKPDGGEAPIHDISEAVRIWISPDDIIDFPFTTSKNVGKYRYTLNESRTFLSTTSIPAWEGELEELAITVELLLPTGSEKIDTGLTIRLNDGCKVEQALPDDWTYTCRYMDVAIVRTYQDLIQGKRTATVELTMKIKQDFKVQIRTPLVNENGVAIGDKTEIAKIFYKNESWNSDEGGDASAGPITYYFKKGEVLTSTKVLAPWEEWTSPSHPYLELRVCIFLPDKSANAFNTFIRISF